tara:strand:- start:172 stop:345 length:174 start_codon:yes stop_codon:yes gene_type:complete
LINDFKNEDILACTIGHEIEHIIYDDHIPQSIKLSAKLMLKFNKLIFDINFSNEKKG